MIKILIVDDEPLAHKILEGYISKLDDMEVAGNCYDGVSTLNFLNSNSVDVVLLDIQMPDITGLELMESLKNTDVKVVFTTAYTEYAIDGFNYDQVVDYLHKPIRITRFVKAINRVKKLLALEGDFESRSKPEIEVEKSEFISLKDNKTIYKIRYDEILYIQSWGNYLKFFLVTDEIKIVRKTIKSIESELPENDFQRIHKSYIVNIQQVRGISGNQVLLNDQKIPIGQSYLIEAKKKVLR